MFYVRLITPPSGTLEPIWNDRRKTQGQITAGDLFFQAACQTVNREFINATINSGTADGKNWNFSWFAWKRRKKIATA